MGRKRRSSGLTVALNGRVVGVFERAANGATRFEYAREWLDWDYAIPVSRSMPLVDRPFTGLSVRAVFDNLLPDDERVRARIATKVGADGVDAFSLLAALGRDCVGALQFLPEGMDPMPPGPPEGEPISAQTIAERIRSLSVAPLGMRGGEDAFRISLAGAQDKTALLYHEGQWLEPIGTTPTTHILKPQIGMVQTSDGPVDLTQSVQNEHVCMALCRALGLEVALTEILELETDLKVLSIKRFDRRLDSKGRLLRIPQEDMCQALGVLPSGKYESDGGPGVAQCLELLKSSDRPDDDRRSFMKAQIVCWLIGATDGHAKNFSIFLGPQGRFRLTPLYDIVSTQCAYDRKQIPRNSFRLAMAIGDNRRYKVTSIAPRHFEQTAKLAGLPTSALKEIMSEIVTRLPSATESVQRTTHGCVPEEMIASIIKAAQCRCEEIQAYLDL